MVSHASAPAVRRGIRHVRVVHRPNSQQPAVVMRCLAYGDTSSTTVRSTNSGAPSKISVIVALAACSPSWRHESFSRAKIATRVLDHQLNPSFIATETILGSCSLRPDEAHRPHHRDDSEPNSGAFELRRGSAVDTSLTRRRRGRSLKCVGEPIAVPEQQSRWKGAAHGGPTGGDRKLTG
jgi:hypothetical protein